MERNSGAVEEVLARFSRMIDGRGLLPSGDWLRLGLWETILDVTSFQRLDTNFKARSPYNIHLHSSGLGSITADIC